MSENGSSNHPVSTVSGSTPETLDWELQGPDDNGHVWIASKITAETGRATIAQNLGPTEQVAEALSQWLGSIDYDETEACRDL